MRLLSWNVNGLRAIYKKGFAEAVAAMAPDILALQETKLQQDQRTGEMLALSGYDSYWDYSVDKKGYSGVAVYARHQPREVRCGFGIDRFDREGRVLQLDYGPFILFNVYFPNGQRDADRLGYKLDFYRDFFAYTDRLREQGRSLVITGDFNTAHNEIDLKNPQANKDRSGFLRIERDVLDDIVTRGYVDTFRALYPDTVKYSWWSYRFNARRNNAGWRIDYFFVSRDLIDRGAVREAFILNEIDGSDHCPVGLELDI
ncbi:exodeoxyribonuclease III [Desulfofustis glycolicus]|uniref:Exodeoxyribonuclease-3 n=1 Tax=Desulfofustis glycolicus DSM 9705 TaxID=1121409 RepID=A0A1M5T3U7_9BACT|nr:exodeoxyribonuclease III [Desulfofustis glycolicus]MCB2215346.1 exodeoxyribonuclease III [Desulfobulbaceae bacterium]SHH45366.1 exodeoxyribonuclease-3 [Desulfofustis glycolicus DSM 9705]